MLWKGFATSWFMKISLMKFDENLESYQSDVTNFWYVSV